MAFPNGLQYNNQLQFNLNIPSDPQNVMTKFQKPGPIILEKIGREGDKQPKPVEPRVSPVKLSNVCEEKLAWAIKLARRDLKNMIHEQQASEENAKKQNVGGKKLKTKATKKSSAFVKGHRPVAKQPAKNVYRKSVKTQTPPTKETYFSRRGLLSNLPPGSVQKLQAERWKNQIQVEKQRQERAAVKSGSPAIEVKPSPNARQAKEIKKLRNELKFYVQRIEKLTEEARHSPSHIMDYEDEKFQLRREIKKAEQTSRSSRLLYSLQQQVRELQDDLQRMDPKKIRHTKRSQILSRLAAAHRGAVRILQAFLHQLPDQVTDEGTLPPIYQELGRLINKLSLCTSHLEVDHSGFPEEVLQIFEKFQTPQSLPSRRKQIPLSTGKSSRRKLEFGRNLLNGQDKRQEKPTVSPLFKEFLPYQPITSERVYGPSQGTAHRIKADVVKQLATPGSPERNAAIKAGLEALMRIDGPEPKVVTKPRPLKPVKVTAKKGQKGVLLATKSKPTRGPRNAGYLQGTKASRLKKQEAARKTTTERGKQDLKPPWAPPGSPRSFLQSPKSPAEGPNVVPEGRTKAEGWEPGPPRIRRVLFEDQQLSGGEGRGRTKWQDGYEQQEAVYDGPKDYSRPLPRDAEAMIDQAEKAIIERLQPLLDKADEIARQEDLSQYRNQGSVQQKLSEKMTEKVTDHAGLLSDLILEDVVTDTAQEMAGIERGREGVRAAAGMANATDLETMLQELEIMEAEEERIRRRWRKVSYYDPLAKGGSSDSSEVPDAKNEMVMGRPLEGQLLERIDEVPVDHTGLKFTSDLPASGRTITIVQPKLSESLIFDSESTSDPSRLHQEEDPFNSEPHLHPDWSKPPQPDWLEPTRTTTILRVSPDMEKRVNAHRKSIEDHLKRKSHLVYGDFDPWKLVTEVSDDLVDGLLQDIAEEMAEYSSGFMDALYKAEFEDAASASGQEQRTELRTELRTGGHS